MPNKKPVDEPTPADAAAVEAGVKQPDTDVPDGMMRMEFRGLDMLVMSPEKQDRSTKVRMARQSLDSARIMAAIVGDMNTRLIAAVVSDDDDYYDVAREFFDAYGKAAGQGNS